MSTEEMSTEEMSTEATTPTPPRSRGSTSRGPPHHGHQRGPHHPGYRARLHSRIKAVLIGPDHEPLATGMFTWENQFVDRLWTYSLEAAWQGSSPATATLPPPFSSGTVCQLSTVGASASRR